MNSDSEVSPEEKALHDLREALASLKLAKPNDGSEKDRRYAVAITETEKVFAYYWTYLTDQYIYSTPK
jgi:hypothetical protein